MRGFLESEYPPSQPETADFHVIPVPYEASVSYGTGTANGPEAILEASQQLEAFIGTSCPGDAGIYTTPPVNCDGTPQEVIERIRGTVQFSLENGSIPIVLGGEHTVTLGAIEAMHKYYDSFGVIQFDAHADLRYTYQDSQFSHACVMRRILERDIPVFQVGVRALSLPEHELRELNHIPHLDAREFTQTGIPGVLLPEDFPETLYITFDVDAFDPSIMPATGTPEPGGLHWYQALELLENVSKGKKIAGFDVVELSPVTGLHACDYTTAKLVYEMMAFISRQYNYS
jgi:agmatinase